MKDLRLILSVYVKHLRQMGNSLRLSLFIFAILLPFGLFAAEDSNQIKSEVRIANLLPYLVHPPLVEPCLPSDFALGEREDDPYFSHGYYWGNVKTVQGYFENPSSLNSCIIRAQVSTNVTQIGLDRFSNDGKTNDLTAAGFTEILVNKGKWGIFPYREVHAKGPKGRHYYQLWVGLNEESGATIYFQLLYPEYINEPTQNQKKIWHDFIKKTSFMSLQDLMVFHEVKKPKIPDVPYKFFVEKRLYDNRYAIMVESQDHIEVDVHEVREINLLSGAFDKPYLELQVDIRENALVKSDTFQVDFTPVDEFTFHSCLLYPKALRITPDFFLLLKR
ncbi:hypothetical protein [Simkania sp.]|uniref:hypothetical protein n=1 Tax=Simkania sp. TaxID=34094 RepID=UPI003B52AAE1